MHGRADIVNEARQSELSRSSAAADGRLRLDDRGAKPRFSKNDGRRQAIRTGANNKGLLPRLPPCATNVCTPLPAILAVPAFREMGPLAARPVESTALRTAVSTTVRFEKAPSA